MNSTVVVKPQDKTMFIMSGTAYMLIVHSTGLLSLLVLVNIYLEPKPVLAMTCIMTSFPTMNDIFFQSLSKLDLKLYLDVFLSAGQDDTGQIMARLHSVYFLCAACC